MKSNRKIRPPNFAVRFLRWYCNEDLQEEIEGDLLELFQFRIRQGSTRKARWLFTWDVLRFFRWSNIKRLNKYHRTNNIAMFKNYIKVSWRNLFRDAVPSFINIFGLSIAIGIAIVGVIYLDWQYNLDSFHKRSDRIYQVISFADLNEQFDEWAMSPITLGPVLSEEIEGVEKQTRMEGFTAIVRQDRDVFRQTVTFVDSTFFEIFDFPLILGDNPLREKTRVAISEQTAIRYFGEMDPIGKTMEITVGDSEKMAFLVGSVFDSRRSHSSMTFEILIPYSNLKTMDLLDEEDWAVNTEATFVLLSDNSSTSEVESLIQNYTDIQNESNENLTIKGFRLQPLESLSVSSYKINGSVAIGNQPMGNLFLSIIGALLLILACINYMNIAIGSTANRLKEIGLRKVIGGNKGTIVRQFLMENVFVCMIALGFGTLVARFFLLPGFNSQTPFEIPFEFSSNAMAVGVFVSILLFTGLLSGAYPAFYVSRFTPIDIFRGKGKFGKKSLLSRILLSLQFVVAFWTVLAGLIFASVSSDLKDRSWGYNPDNLIVIPISTEKQLEGLREVVSQQSGVVEVSGGKQHIGVQSSSTDVKISNEYKRVVRFDVGHNYPEMLGLSLVEGRFFTVDSESDRMASVVVNARFQELIGRDEIIGYQIEEGDQKYTVVGVVDDFYYENFYQQIRPVIFHPVGESDYNYLLVRTQAANLDQISAVLEDTWKVVEPDRPYEGEKQAEVLDYFFQNLDANSRVLGFYSIVALILACMGLFGLVTFNTNRRLKEFSIHRIFGASTRSITKKITFDFLWLLVIGLVVGGPLGYLTMSGLLDQMFPQAAPIGILPLTIGAGAVLVTALITVLSQILKVIRRNPANVLRE